MPKVNNSSRSVLLLLLIALAIGCDDSSGRRPNSEMPPQSSGASAATAGNTSAPLATAIAWTRAVASGNLAAAKALSDGDSAALAGLESIVGFAASSEKLQAVSMQKFGASPPTYESVLMKRTENTSEQIDGDVATLTPANGQPPFKLRRQPDGAWKVDISEFGRDPQLARQFQSMMRVVDEMVAETAAGKYASAAEAQKALSDKYKQAQSPTPAPAAGDGLE